jgi:hypothetical protein
MPAKTDRCVDARLRDVVARLADEINWADFESGRAWCIDHIAISSLAVNVSSAPFE